MGLTGERGKQEVFQPGNDVFFVALFEGGRGEAEADQGGGHEGGRTRGHLWGQEWRGELGGNARGRA